MLFLTSLSQIIVSVAFAYSLVMFDYIQTNERMVQQERLAFLGLMDAKLAHEIRSPIVIIRNLSNILLSQLRSNQKEDALDLTTEIQQNADNTLALISAIRADLKQDKPQNSDVNVEEMVDEAVEIIKRSTAKNILIEIKLDENLSRVRQHATCLEIKSISLKMKVAAFILVLAQHRFCIFISPFTAVGGHFFSIPL